jgi:hypothetical protein
LLRNAVQVIIETKSIDVLYPGGNGDFDAHPSKPKAE